MTVRDILMAASGVGGTPPPASTDPQFNYVTMLLHGDGTNGAQNNTFVDSSTNNFTITRNGTPTQGSFSPYGDLWSNQFSGTVGNYVSVPDNAGFQFGSGDFTIEGWMYLNSLTASSYFLGKGDRASVAGSAFSLPLTNYTMDFYAGSSVFSLSTFTPTLNTWFHIAIVRSGTTITRYINGVSNASVTIGTASINTGGTNEVRIGGYVNSTGFLGINGYLSNLRIVKGTALYTTNFTPSTTPLTAVSGTSLLTCQSNRFRDASSNNFAITVTGTPSVQRFSPFEPSAGYDASVIGGSGYFNGSTDSVNTPTSAAVLGTNNWTFECLVYLNAKPAFGQVMGMRKGTATSADQYVPVVIAITSTGFALYSSSNSTSWDIANGVAFGGTAVVNQWYHVAVVRNGSAIYGYVNGVQTTLVASTSANYTSTNSIFAGGAQASDRVNCYVSSARAVNGTAVYTAAFTPPTAPLTAITNTSLLLNCVNAGIYDNAMMNDLVTVGNAQVSTAVVKYGTGSMKFDGTGDYIDTTSPSFTFGSGDFTLEYWIYFNSFSLAPTVLDNRFGTIASNFVIYDASGSGLMTLYLANANRANFQASINQWYHMAVCKASGTTRFFVNGTQQGSNYTDTNTYSSGKLRLGANLNGTNFLNGYIDDLRITQGVARYTANFTPPTAPFPNN